MAQLFANNASAKLASAIASGDTTIILQAGQGAEFPSPTGSDYFLITLISNAGREIAKCTARSTDTLTVVRGQEGFTALDFAAGDTVASYATKGTLENFVQRGLATASGLTLAATDKLLGRATSGAGAVEEITLTSAGRALIDDADAAAQRTTLGLGTAATLASDTDGTLAADSDSRSATQKAVKTYVDSAVGGVSVTDASLSTSDITTNNASSTKHGFAPKAPADATQFLNGAATPAFAQVKDSDLSLSDITTNNVSTTKHGFAPKAPNDASKFLDGTGAWTAPGGSGGSGGVLAHNYLGYNTIGGSSVSMSRRRVYMKKITLASAGMIASIGAYVKNSTGNVGSLSVALLSDNSGSPDLLLAYSGVTSTDLLPTVSGPATTARWLHRNLGYWATAGDYWIAVMDVSAGVGGNRTEIFYDGSGSDHYYDTGGDWFADAGFYSNTTDTNKYSIRASVLS